VETGVDRRVEFRGWVSREEVQRTMREEAEVFLFPSYRDQAPLAVAEAVGVGLPVVCLDRGGAPLLGGTAVRGSTPKATSISFAEAIRTAHERSEPLPPDLGDQRERLADVLGERGLLRQ
jgi:glycosyltransferase involved in cell wall biosynthesis